MADPVYYAVVPQLINGVEYDAGDAVAGLSAGAALRLVRRGLLVGDAAGTTDPSEIVALIVNDPTALGALADALGITLPG